ncbi:MAG: hypothetical protein ACRYF4_05600 [Janthinobacterium lividum]
MFRALIVLMLLTSASTNAQEKCGFGGDDNFNRTQQLLREAKTCTESAKLLRNCAWGSSADSMFAGIVIPKCEATFRSSLSSAEAKRYTQEMRSCSLRYEKQQGTMSISAAALCATDVAASYSSDAARRREKLRKASFDCNLASSPLERAICSDQALGDSDIILNRVYTETLHQKDFPFVVALRNGERSWIRELPAHCKFPSGLDTKCLREQFINRLTLIDTCTPMEAETRQTDEGYAACLKDVSLLRE